MRNTLLAGLLLCLPTAVLLASAWLVMLVGRLCRRPGTVLPDADRVARRVPGHRHPEVTFGVRLGGHFTAGLRDPGQGLVDVLHVDVRNDSGLACNRQVRHEVADDVAGGVLEGVAVFSDLPAEHTAVEGRRTRGVRSRDAQIRDVTGTEHRDLGHMLDPSWPGPGHVCGGGPRRSTSRAVRPEGGRRRLVPP